MALSMKTSVRTLSVLGALGLVSWAAWLVLNPGEALEDAAEEAILGPDGEPIDAREENRIERARLAAVARGLSPRETTMRSEALVSEEEVPPPPQLADAHGEITREQAELGFDYAMRRVERLARKSRHKKLLREDWDALYREANDAFSALSIHLDATDTQDLATLERAHARLKKSLGKVKVRGRKFKY